mgnify:CR=1 FL=1
MSLEKAVAQARQALLNAADADDIGAALDETVAACEALVLALARRRTSRMPELMGSAEACELLGVKSGNLRQLSGLPDPVADLKATSVWLGSSLRAYAEVLEERRAGRES